MSEVIIIFSLKGDTILLIEWICQAGCNLTMCKFTKKNISTLEPIIDNITLSTKKVLEEEGLINFRVGRIISDANCSSKTFYQVYESKSDLLLCLWVRGSVSNYLVNLHKDNCKLSDLELMLLPIILTLTLRELDSGTSKTALSTCVNSSVWSGVNSRKSIKVKNRVNFFWTWVRHYAKNLLISGKVSGTEDDIFLLCDKLSYLLRGFIMVDDTNMVSEQSRCSGPSSFLAVIANEFTAFGIETDVISRAVKKCESKISFLISRDKGIMNCRRCEHLDIEFEQFSFIEGRV